MVRFTNIIFDEEWIYADAEGFDFKVAGKIKINRKTEEYVADFDDIYSMVHKAAISMLIRVDEGKLKQGDGLVIAWG